MGIEQQPGVNKYGKVEFGLEKSRISNETMRELMSFLSAIETSVNDSGASVTEKMEILKRVKYLEDQLEALRH
ncbi:MAG: hypothetical protein A3H51_01105 [Candidatus Spechtbacteria bacterium RIFCSPLOWO2_02_FULL_38_8]|uniref:Uncharacterized protein n=1 Tax=Candidatus Spechtbacteria bacterium RIFCSPLOWO2_02_FULL_38_8 TaxID=1802164 RepID=A0A1G2HKT8_9BACT|nr:MAG: hypothetical protein A3H51_01105 [Candidatus Spechtbacteria bacterium RIFCSPLOWO2_02_FULL_38_8]